MTEPSLPTESCYRCGQEKTPEGTVRLIIARVVALAVFLGLGFGLDEPVHRVVSTGMATLVLFLVLAVASIASFKLVLRGRCSQCAQVDKRVVEPQD